MFRAAGAAPLSDTQLGLDSDGRWTRGSTAETNPIMVSFRVLRSCSAH